MTPHTHPSIEHARNRKGAQNRRLAERAREIVRQWAKGADTEALMARLAAEVAQEGRG